MARIVKEFETILPQNRSSTKHHEQKPAVQISFAKEVTSLISVIERKGNPFTENSQDLIALDRLDIANSEVARTVKTVLDVGTTQYYTFVSERFIQRTKPISDPIHKNNFPLFSAPKGVPFQRRSNKLHH